MLDDCNGALWPSLFDNAAKAFNESDTDTESSDEGECDAQETNAILKV
jgi:hypothetical protein